MVQGRETVVTTGSHPVPSEAVREAVTTALYVLRNDRGYDPLPSERRGRS